jgi:TPR repeat protein
MQEKLNNWVVKMIDSSISETSSYYCEFNSEENDSKKVEELLCLAQFHAISNPELSNKFYIEAAKLGCIDAIYFLVLKYTQKISEFIDMKQTFQYCLSSATRGEMKGQFLTGYSYYHGLGVDRGKALAIHFYELAADQGLAVAQNNLGYYFGMENTVHSDLEKAIHFYTLAANQGLAVAQLRLGIFFFQGHGVDKDPSKAVQLFTLAADQGHAAAHDSLGYCFESGGGVNKDLAKAVKNWKLAADQGLSTSVAKLKCLFECKISYESAFS